MEETKIVLVVGATGRQGGATARELLERGWRVRALVRNPESTTALSLKEAGAELCQGDLEDSNSLAVALTGVYGVFSVQNYWAKGTGYEGEIRQGRNLATEAKKAGVQHFVQASIVDCDRAAEVEHFECKHVLENLVDELKLPRTFLRTVFFMENFTDPKTAKLMFPVLAGALQADFPLHMVSTDDVGRLAASAFENPETYLHKSVDLAGDVLTVGQMKAAYQRVNGAPPPRWRMPLWLLRLVNRDMAQQFAWNQSNGWTVSIAEVQRLLPNVTDFETFLRSHRN